MGAHAGQTVAMLRQKLSEAGRWQPRSERVDMNRANDVTNCTHK